MISTKSRCVVQAFNGKMWPFKKNNAVINKLFAHLPKRHNNLSHGLCPIWFFDFERKSLSLHFGQ